MRVAVIVTCAGLVACGRLGFDPFGAAARDSGGDDGDLIGPPSEASIVAMPITPLGSTSVTATTITLAAVTLQPGDMLLVITNHHITDTISLTWNGVGLNEDVEAQTWGSGPMYTGIWSLYSAAGGTGDIVGTSSASHSVDIIASAVAGLMPSLSLDTSGYDTGTGTTALSTQTPTTTSADELLYAAVAGDDATALTGAWTNGFTAGQSVVGTNEETSEGWQLVSATGSYASGRTGFASQDWCAEIATYRRVAGAFVWMPTTPETGPFSVPLSKTAGNVCSPAGTMAACSMPDGLDLWWHYASCTCE